MKCRAKTYKYHSNPCPNNGAVDGYCYLHHPEVMLAKLRFQFRADRPADQWAIPVAELPVRIKEQEALLAEIAAQPVVLSPRMDAAVAAGDCLPPAGANSPATPGGSARSDRVVISP